VFFHGAITGKNMHILKGFLKLFLLPFVLIITVLLVPVWLVIILPFATFEICFKPKGYTKTIDFLLDLMPLNFLFNFLDW
jgi:hypothetical protein